MRTKKGVITSAKMTGTVSVAVHRLVFHAVYKKRFRKSKKFLCDSNGMDLYEGDKVVIEECKPLSKNKHFKVIQIIKAAPRVADMKDDAAIAQVTHREKTGADKEAKEAKEKKEAKESKEVTEGAEGAEANSTSETSDSSETSATSNQE